MRISDWSSDVCSSDLVFLVVGEARAPGDIEIIRKIKREVTERRQFLVAVPDRGSEERAEGPRKLRVGRRIAGNNVGRERIDPLMRSEEHTSELQSLMRISYAVFCLKKKNTRMPTTP